MSRCICCDSKYECGCKDFGQSLFDLKNAEIEIEKLKADLKREQVLIDKFIVTTDNLLTHSNEDYEWQTEQLIKLARLTQQQRREG